MYVCVYACEGRCPRRPEVLNCLGSGVTDSWVLGIELVSPGRAVYTLNQ